MLYALFGHGTEATYTVSNTREHKGTLCSIMHVESFESLPIDGHTDLLIDSSSRVKYRGRVAILTTRSLLPIVHRG